MTKIFVCGDIVNNFTDNLFCDTHLKKLIRSADYSVCNFEAPVGRIGQQLTLKAGPSISQRKETITLLKEQGFELLLLANNHMLDYGVEGLKETLNEAEKQLIDTIGANFDVLSTYRPLIKNLNGIKFGFINACEAQFGQLIDDNKQEGGYAWINHWLVDECLYKLQQEVDFIIFFAHAGLEQYDVPLIEWRERYKRLCDLGVDCVVASHPHVSQGYEQYNGKYIFYSLGNFFFPGERSLHTDEYGYSVVLNFELGKNIEPEIIYHVRQKLTVKRIDKKDSPISIESLNNKLEENVYLSYVNDVYCNAYKEICYKYYANALNSIEKDDALTIKCKKVIKQLFFPDRNKRERELLLLHLTRNETYRYITQRALEDRIYK